MKANEIWAIVWVCGAIGTFIVLGMINRKTPAGKKDTTGEVILMASAWPFYMIMLVAGVTLTVAEWTYKKLAGVTHDS